MISLNDALSIVGIISCTILVVTGCTDDNFADSTCDAEMYETILAVGFAETVTESDNETGNTIQTWWYERTVINFIYGESFETCRIGLYAFPTDTEIQIP